MKKFFIVVFIILFGIGILFYPKLSTTLYIVTGFSAKNICSGHFVSRFKVEDIAEQALQPINKAFGLISYKVDEIKKSVAADIFGLFEQHAYYRKGLGCTLAAIDNDLPRTGITPLIQTSQSPSAAWPLGSGAATMDSSVDYAALSKVIDRAFSEPESTGKRHVKSVIIIYKGQLIAERYADGVSADTLLLSWSMAKSITNLQVGLLVKSGKLDLLEPANVPAWKNPTDPRAKITLDQLMRMSSGLTFNEAYGLNTDVSRMLAIETDTAAFAANKSLQYEPDTHWSYSSGSTNIVAAIIKRTIGGNLQQYYEFTQRQLFHPLGIYSGVLETDASDTFISSSYLYANARDWAKLGQLMLQNGRWNDAQILPIDWVKYSTTPTKTSLRNHYGAKFWLNLDPQLPEQHRKWPSVPVDAYYMGGYQGQYVVIIPSKNLVIVRLGFTKPGTESGIEMLISGTIAAISVTAD